MADDPIREEPHPETSVPPPPVVEERRIAPLTDAEIIELRRRLDDDPVEQGSNRFTWFIIGFVAALLAIAVAALVFLAISDSDDDGNIELDVPSVEVDG